MANVLVLGEDTRSFLSVIRSLGKDGWNVDVVCYNQESASLASRYIKQKFYFNYQAHTNEQWLENLITLIHEQQYDLVIPCDERALFPIYENQHLFPTATKLAIPNKQVIDHLFDKFTTKALAIQCEVPVALGRMMSLKHTTYQQLQDEFATPFVIKPTLSFASESLAKRQKVEIIDDEQTYSSWQKHIAENDEFLVEQYFTGTGEGVSLLAVNGQVQFLFAHTRVNEPKTGGGSSYRKSIAVDTGMANACIKMCAATKFNGVAMFEFKKNLETQHWILVEVNARFWGSLPLAIYAGIDFPKLYADVLMNRCTLNNYPNDHYRINVYGRSLSNDMYDIKAELEYEKQQSGWLSALTHLASRGIGFTRILLFKERVDSFDWQDRAPFWQELKQLYVNTVGHRFKKPDSSQQYLETKRFLKAVYQNDHHPVIKVVCYGNIMRSPFAKAYLEYLCSETKLHWSIESYGFHQHENRQSPKDCIIVARKMGIDLNSHRSKWIRQEHIKPSDIIIVFDQQNEIKLQEFYQCKNVFNLASFVPKGMGQYREIADPYGQGEESVMHCYKLIAEAVKNLFEQYRMNVYKIDKMSE